MSAPAFKQARISDDLTLAYVDSWHARAKEDLPERYKTVVGLHRPVWTPLLPALPSSIRFLAYNQRSYAQSSPAFNAKQPGGTDATATYLCDLMEFLRFAVEELGVQGMDEQTHEGGSSFWCGWSKGTVLCFSLLSLIHLASSPSPTSFLTHLPTSGLPHTSLLRTHIRSLILFEPPGSALGRPPTSDYTTAMRVAFLQEEELALAHAKRRSFREALNARMQVMNALAHVMDDCSIEAVGILSSLQGDDLADGDAEHGLRREYDLGSDAGDSIAPSQSASQAMSRASSSSSLSSLNLQQASPIPHDLQIDPSSRGAEADSSDDDVPRNLTKHVNDPKHASRP
ncbi:hypothetical protein Rt10032_c01g0598 [Rhodotorula toruloides]|uniref:Uncharacterized protein n=1 Tax=Rhodotorula toruloides TaxID=5286 RepID=A0A511K8A7_RHOTO|nr:hypothetical protein Rt10032_c01g0598 [Rhodotorula toruloides]